MQRPLSCSSLSAASVLPSPLISSHGLLMLALHRLQTCRSAWERRIGVQAAATGTGTLFACAHHAPRALKMSVLVTMPITLADWSTTGILCTCNSKGHISQAHAQPHANARQQTLCRPGLERNHRSTSRAHQQFPTSLSHLVLQHEGGCVCHLVVRASSHWRRAHDVLHVGAGLAEVLL